MPLGLRALPTAGLTAYWTFDGTLENATFASGNTDPADPSNLDLSAEGGFAFDPDGLFGQAARFDGEGAYLRIATDGEPKRVVGDDSVVPGTTISVWFKADSAPTGSERFFIYETAPTFTLSLGLRAGSEGNTQVQLFTESPSVANPNIFVEVPNSVIDGQWVHVAATLSLDQDEFAVIVNGGDDFPNGATTTGPLNVPDLATFDNFHIGTYRGANGRWFPGLMDGFAVWDRILTEDELKSLFTIYEVTVTTAEDEDDGFLGGGSGISLREAINHAPAGATITFDPALSGETITLTEGQLLIDKALIIDASALPRGIAIDANGAVTNHRVLEITPEHAVTLENMTLTGGNATGPVPASRGGAIYNNGSSLRLIACTLSGNSGGSGGAVYNDGSSEPATLDLERSTLSGNTAGFEGGGLFNDGRSAGSSTSVTVTNCTLSGNSAATGGGAILNDGGSGGSANLEIIHSTLHGNDAGSTGGGVANQGSGGFAPVTLVNSIVANNTAPLGPEILNNAGVIMTAGTNLVTDLSNSGLDPATDDIIVADPDLAPLGDNGGRTATKPPNPGSPAINAAGLTTSVATDQRGAPRLAGGAPDIGAVEVQPSLTVDTTSDTGIGSLRQAIGFAAPDATITFDPALSGKTLVLTGGQLLIDKSLTIDASDLPAPLVIDAGGQSRVMEIAPGNTVALHSLTLTGGNATGGFPADLGGAIYNANSTLTLADCTISGNAARSGGGINNFSLGGGPSTLTLIRCLVFNNSATTTGGGISNNGFDGGNAITTLTNTTLSGNSADIFGGGIFNISIRGGDATTTLAHCTVAGNSANDEGGGMYISSGGTGISHLTLANCIVAANTTNGAGMDIRTSVATIEANGVNLLSDLSDSGLDEAEPGILLADPLLAEPGDYGGPTPTMPPLPGSPAIDAADPTGLATDQRGAPRVTGGAPDIGAVEFQPVVVTTTSDAPDASGLTLRQAIAREFVSAITFAPELSGETIALGQGQLVIDKSLAIDASGLGASPVIDAGGQSRVMEIRPGHTVSLHSLVLTGGNTGGPSDSGGAILNDRSNLTLTACVISGNTATSLGGGIHNNGSAGSASLTLVACTLSHNESFFGGGVYNLGVGGKAGLTIVNSTVFGNTAISGGGIFNDAQSSGSATLGLTASTVTGNSAAGGTGGILSQGTGADVMLTNNIIADNQPSDSASDFRNTNGTATAAGVNLFTSLTGSGLAEGETVLLTADPRLAPLANYGGPTETMPPLPDSPAVNAAAPTALTTDQRGLPRPVGNAPDIGAVEFQGAADLAFIWDADFDGNGRPFGLDFAIGPDGDLAVPVRDSEGGVGLGFPFNPQAAGLASWTLESSPDLSPGSWIPVFRSSDPEESSAWEFPDDITVTLDAGSDRISIHDDRTAGRAFYRLAVETVGL